VRPLISVLARHGTARLSIDPPGLSRLSLAFPSPPRRVAARFRRLRRADHVGSPSKRGDIIFGKMGLPGGQQDKTGSWSTSAQFSR